MEETIAAVATAYGEGGIGIIRISGENAEKLLREVFVPNSGKPVENRMMTYGHIIDPGNGETLDEVLAVLMKAPNTYTREDVVEINCHGSVIALKNVLALCLRHGARMAEPGEFTKRAFLNGRLDLSEAEAVIDLIRAKTDKSFDVSMSQLRGALSEEIRAIRKDILDLLVEVTVNIDYPDEDIEELTYKKLSESIAAIRGNIEKLLSSADSGRILREGLNVAIVGKPNVGKSSLMNALLKESRAIVTEIPGTTRDTIEEMLSIRGIPVKLTDTAGIRQTQDVIEKIGIEKSKEAFNEADLVIFILDGSRSLDEEDLEIMEVIGDRKAIVLINKSDLGRNVRTDEIRQKLPQSEVIETSIINGEGLETVENTIESMVYSGETVQKNSCMVTSVRHIELLNQASDSMRDAGEMTARGEALDFIEVDINAAYQSLGEIIGEAVADDIINEVFSRFCLGK